MTLYNQANRELIADIQSGRFAPRKASPNETVMTALRVTRVSIINTCGHEFGSSFTASP